MSVPVSYQHASVTLPIYGKLAGVMDSTADPGQVPENIFEIRLKSEPVTKAKLDMEMDRHTLHI